MMIYIYVLVFGILSIEVVEHCHIYFVFIMLEKHIEYIWYLKKLPNLYHCIGKIIYNSWFISQAIICYILVLLQHD